MPDPVQPPTLRNYALLVMRVGLTSFGGGVSGWMMRMVVEERGWMTEGEFLTGLSLCQVFPGVNVVNLAIWLGYRMHGGVGAILGALMMVAPPAFVLLGIATAFASVSDQGWVRIALNGVAAAALGMSGAMAVRAWRRAATGLVPIALGVTTTVLVGVLHWPLVPVVLPIAALSILLALRSA